MSAILIKTRDVKPLLMTKAISQKLRTIKPELNSESHSDVSKQLDELVEAFDKGHVSLPEYCSRLNRLLAAVA